MSDTARLVVLFGVIGALALMAVHGYVVQRRQLSSGRMLCAVRLLRDEGRLVATARVSISTPGKWCRLLLGLRTEGRYEERSRPFRGKAAMLVGTPYTLAIAGRSGDVLYRESDTLTRFVPRLGSRSRDWSFLSHERSSWTHRGRVTVLEFVPREAGLHQIGLEIEARAETTTEWSSSSCEVLEAELTVMEGVEPLTRFVRYPHRRVQL